MNLILVEVWHAQKNVPTKYRCGSDWLSYSDALDGSLSRRGDYKLRCTLTTGVSQILYFTKLIPEIKAYSFQRIFILSTRLLPHCCYLWLS
jgi:hypothetical protein